MKDYFVEQSDYQRWACQVLGVSLDTLTDEQRNSDLGLFFRSIHKTFDHILVVTRNWRARLEKNFDRVLSYDVVLYQDWEQLKRALDEEFEELGTWLSRQPSDWFQQNLSYPGTGGEQKTIKIMDALIHIMTHAVHHRGQITAACTRLGAPSPEMDFVYYRWRKR